MTRLGYQIPNFTYPKVGPGGSPCSARPSHRWLPDPAFSRGIASRTNDSTKVSAVS